jgi:hypothetical protein
VEVKIGIQCAPRELVVETGTSHEQVQRDLTDALSSGGVFVLQDAKGSRVLVPAAKIAYVELGGSEQRRVGFGSL